MDWRSCCIFSNSSCLGLYLASTSADVFLSSSESIIAFWTLTTAILSWADATVARGARTNKTKPARMARERNIFLGLLRMETHRLTHRRGPWLRPPAHRLHFILETDCFRLTSGFTRISGNQFSEGRSA